MHRDGLLADLLTMATLMKVLLIVVHLYSHKVNMQSCVANRAMLLYLIINLHIVYVCRLYVNVVSMNPFTHFTNFYLYILVRKGGYPPAFLYFI